MVCILKEVAMVEVYFWRYKPLEKSEPNIFSEERQVSFPTPSTSTLSARLDPVAIRIDVKNYYI
jgi:hypothetical protein